LLTQSSSNGFLDWTARRIYGDGISHRCWRVFGGK